MEKLLSYLSSSCKANGSDFLQVPRIHYILLIGHILLAIAQYESIQFVTLPKENNIQYASLYTLYPHLLSH